MPQECAGRLGQGGYASGMSIPGITENTMLEGRAAVCATACVAGSSSSVSKFRRSSLPHGDAQLRARPEAMRERMDLDAQWRPPAGRVRRDVGLEVRLHGLRLRGLRRGRKTRARSGNELRCSRSLGVAASTA